MKDIFIILFFMFFVMIEKKIWNSWIPNTRRIIWAGVCLVMSTIYLYRISIGFEYPIMSSIIALVITIGGLSLFTIAFVPKLQASRFEYCGWALTQGLGTGLLLGQAFFPKSQSVELVTGLIGIVISYSHQQVNKKAYSHLDSGTL